MIRNFHAWSGFVGIIWLSGTGADWAQSPAPPAPPATTVPASSPARSFRLSEAMAEAYQSNPQLAEARAALQALDQGVAEANAGWRPSVNASVQQGYSHGIISGFPGGLDTSPTIGQVTVTQHLFRGGRTDAEISRAISQVQAGRSRLTSTEQSVLLGAVTAYMDVLRDLQTVGYAHDNVHSLEEELKDVQTELSAGAVTRADEYQVEARLARARADQVNAENQLAASRAAYQNVIGRPVGTLTADISLPHLPVTKEEALDIALKLNPDLNQARAAPNPTIPAPAIRTVSSPLLFAMTELLTMNGYSGGRDNAAARKAFLPPG